MENVTYLADCYKDGMTVEQYLDLLEGARRDLHALYARRAEIDPDAVARLRAARSHRVLVVTEPWCGDSLAIFPVIVELCRLGGIELRVVRRDERLDLIARYLTNGARAIPIAIALDERFEEICHWGPRPGPAQAMFDRHRESVATGRMDKAEVHKQIRAFYARDRGRTIVKEWLAGLGDALSVRRASAGSSSSRRGAR